MQGGEGVEAMWEWRERGSEMGVKERRGEGAEGRRSGLLSSTAVPNRYKVQAQVYATAVPNRYNDNNTRRYSLCTSVGIPPRAPRARSREVARVMDAFMSMGLLSEA